MQNALEPTVSLEDAPHRLTQPLVEFLESGNPPHGLFARDVFCDFTMPHWRLQAQGLDGLVALRKAGHPGQAEVVRWRSDTTARGFVLEFEERWDQDGQRWYAREMARADVSEDGITALAIYCTGDWDEALQHRHAKGVTLIRP